nr:MAG TPA: hypothetical protein [Caudoviricetes sp.]
MSIMSLSPLKFILIYANEPNSICLASPPFDW